MTALFSIGQYRAMPRFEARRQQQPAKPLLLNLDIDSTLIKWNRLNKEPDEILLKRNINTVKSLQDKATIFVNTGRGIAEMKMIAPFLKHLPIQYLGLNGGQELYINRKNKPTEEWINSLKPRHQNRTWKRHLQQQTGWKLHTIMQTINRVFRQAGFRRAAAEDSPYPTYPTLALNHPSGEKITAIVLKTEPRVYITNNREPLMPVHTEVSQDLAQRIHTAVQEKGIKANLVRKASFNVRVPVSSFLLEPPGFNKSVLAQHLTKTLPGVKAVISAGDTGIDREMLLQVDYMNKHGQSVPNYPILSGDNQELLQKLQSQQGSRFVQVPEADLTGGIQAQLAKINLSERKAG